MKLISLFLLSCSSVQVESGWNSYRGNDVSSYQRRTTCTRETPCYDVTMTIIIDGQFIPDPTPGLVLKRYKEAGFTTEQAIQDGRMALAFFEQKYGITFSGITDEQLFVNGAQYPSDDGTALLQPTGVNRSNRFRVHSVSVGETSQVINAPVYDWFLGVNVTRDRAAAGSYNRPIPAGGFLTYGYYEARQCPVPPIPGRSCPQYSILTPDNPRSSVLIHFRTQAYLQFGLPPTGYIFVDLDIYSKYLGQGSGHGYIPFREGTTDGTVEGRYVFTFPEHRF